MRARFRCRYPVVRRTGDRERGRDVDERGFRVGARVDVNSGFSAAAEVVGGREPWPRATVLAAATHAWLRYLLFRGSRRGKK